MNRIRVYGVTCVLMMVAMAASATTIVLPTDEQLIAKTPVIVDGTVVSTTPVERDGAIWTDTVVSVARTLKGTAGATITVHQLGGELDERITKIFGAPEFASGERVLLFLEPSPRGGYRTIDLYVGKFSEASTMNGERLWLRDDTSEVTLLDGDLQPIEGKNVQRDAARFENFVFDRIAGREGVRNYGVENPVLARDGASGGRKLEANFTLIADPTVYRWGRFDSGQSATWYSSGTQPGYTGGGVSELQTAMGAWTNYSQAKILYTYAGSRSGSMGGLDAPNGVNEVLFNDPLNEISGTWNRNTGGVVGTGGFNGVSGSANWTGPFYYDASHKDVTYRAYNISEGNLVVQDGVSSATGISSSRLAEIIAHEFGHTLGFGHSPDNTALMYATVTGLGPSLRADDQIAARWLYPNGSAPPPPTVQVPAAPSGVVATASGSSINVTWNDNANNETGQAVYLATATGGFGKVADVAANVESTKLSGLSSGSYRIYVIAYNSAGNSSQSNIATATIASAPVAAFSFTPQSGTAGVTTFTFYDESTGSVSSRSWSFGDGATSTAQVATHLYARAGQYIVTLTVTGSGGSSQISQAINVSGPLAPSFSWSPSNPTPSDTLQFIDESAGGPTSWSWSFGDGTSSVQQNPQKRFTAPGTYNVTLTIMRGGESAAVTRAIAVTSSVPVTPGVVAAFDLSSANVSIGDTVAFYDRSSNATSWSWSFGDGATSNAQNPVHSYAGPGTYSVTLNAANATSSASITKQVVVASAQPYRSLISVTAQTSGVGGTSWRTELSFFNAGTQGASVALVFIPGAGGSVVTRDLYLAPKQSSTYANALLDLFGMANGAGALAIEATSAGTTADLRVTSRTFTTGDSGTYGQSVPDVQPETLEKTLYVTGIQSSSAFRTNIGLVNRGASAVAATLTLYNASGSTIATKNITLPGNNFQQLTLAGLFPETAGRTYAALSMRIVAASQAAVSVYASVIDNRTQDPIYIQAAAAPATRALTVPVVGRAPGANGTFWRSDVTFFNPTADRLTLTLRYGGASKTLVLDARDTQVIDDVLSQFGQTSGSGTLRVSWSGDTGPVVTSRTYTSVGGGGTYGQSIDGVLSFESSLFVAGLRNDASYRSNVGFVNGGSETETFTVALLSPSGNELASTTVTLGANGQQQVPVSALFPGVPQSNFTLAVRGDANAQLFAYGSMVDNASGDPVFFAGR